MEGKTNYDWLVLLKMPIELQEGKSLTRYWSEASGKS